MFKFYSLNFILFFIFAIITPNLTPLALGDTWKIVIGAILLDLLHTGWHFYAHKNNSGCHMRHHRKDGYSASALDTDEVLLYASFILGISMLLSWSFFYNVWVLTGMTMFLHIINILGHNGLWSGKWHKVHHSNCDVNFSFSRLPDLIMKTDSSKSKKHFRKLIAFAFYISVSVVTSLLVIALSWTKV